MKQIQTFTGWDNKVVHENVNTFIADNINEIDTTITDIQFQATKIGYSVMIVYEHKGKLKL